jgi:hypothetical protein
MATATDTATATARATATAKKQISEIVSARRSSVLILSLSKDSLLNRIDRHVASNIVRFDLKTSIKY